MNLRAEAAPYLAAERSAVRFSRSAERYIFLLGLALLAVSMFPRVIGYLQARAALASYDLERPSRSTKQANLLRHVAGDPIAVLEVPRIDLRVPVFEGTDERTLDRGAGHIEGTAAPGEDGNVGIAAHRDSFFRALKDIALGDEVRIATADYTQTYVVERLRVVNPDEVSVLQPGRAPKVTLVNCYPFYSVGPAPQRYIVEATLSSQHALGIVMP